MVPVKGPNVIVCRNREVENTASIDFKNTLEVKLAAFFERKQRHVRCRRKNMGDKVKTVQSESDRV